MYARSPSFDPKVDSIVRVEATKLRARLGAYYALNGSSDELGICIPKGGYVPEFHNYGRPLVHGSAGEQQVSELCDIAFAALMRSTPASLEVAAACFAEARNLNPSDPRPHIGLANCYGFALSSEAKPPSEVMDELRKSSSKALQLNETSGDAHVAASICHFFVDGTTGKAMKEARRALQLEPQSAIAHFWAPALLSAAGRHEASLAHMREAIRCAPNCTLFGVFLGRVLYYAGRSAEAVQVLKDVGRAEPALAAVIYGLRWHTRKSGNTMRLSMRRRTPFVYLKRTQLLALRPMYWPGLEAGKKQSAFSIVSARINPMATYRLLISPRSRAR